MAKKISPYIVKNNQIQTKAHKNIFSLIKPCSNLSLVDHIIFNIGLTKPAEKQKQTLLVE